VIREMPADTGKMLHDFYTGPGQLALIANTGLHKNLGRVDRAERKDDPAASGHPMTLTVAKEFDSDGALAVKYDTRHQRAGEPCEVAAIHIGVCIGSEGRQPPA
jgi:hypothetical protein